MGTGDSGCLAWLSLLLALSAFWPLAAAAQEAPELKTFRIKYVAEGAVYIEGGSASGLKTGQVLTVDRPPSQAQPQSGETGPPASGPIATLTVLSLTASSAVCEITEQTAAPEVGDVARLAPQEVHAELEEKREERMTGARDYAQVVTFNTVDPVEEEVRASIPRPPSPEINRMRGRIGFEFDTVMSQTTPSSTSTAFGMMARVDMTRIFGTYWNLNGFWRGRFTSLSGSAQPATITDLINRTYTLALTYQNPESHLVAGFGRLYLPWATSLDAIDGGYLGRRTGDHATFGVFAGSTPDPASYDYNPNQRIAGTFLNFQGGSFESTRYSATFGLALTAVDWYATRQFFFTETGITVKRNFAIYEAMEVDASHTVVTDPGNPAVTPPVPPTIAHTGGLNRSYLTVRFQPHPRIELNVTDTYYRDIPTFDPLLIGTGLLDRYLFQGLSGGVRVTLPKKINVYTDLGKSSRTGDSSNSWNQMYGISFGGLGRTGFQADFHYSKFSSSFGSGTYEVGSLSHSLGERWQLNVQGGVQNLTSTLTATGMTHFFTSNLEWAPGRQVFFQSGFTYQRGGTMNYNQLLFMVGRRF
jgi:hypothetical protein